MPKLSDSPILELVDRGVTPRAFEIYLDVCHKGGTLVEAYDRMMGEGYEEDARNMVDTIMQLRETEVLH